MTKEARNKRLNEVRLKTFKELREVRQTVRNTGDFDRFIKKEGTHVYSNGLYKSLSVTFVSSFRMIRDNG